MTDEEYNSNLEILAKLIENTAHNVSDAAQIVRNSKIEVEVNNKIQDSFLSFNSEELAFPEIHVGKKFDGKK